MKSVGLENDANKKKKVLTSNLRKLRELRGLTREAVAHELNISPSGYSKIERGEVELTLHKLFLLEQVLDFDTHQLLNQDITTILPFKSSTVAAVEKGNSVDEGTPGYKEKLMQLFDQIINDSATN